MNDEMSKNKTIDVKGTEIAIIQKGQDDFIPFTDIATLEKLVVLSNLESINAVLIHQGLQQPERLFQLNKIAITQMKSLLNRPNTIKEIK